MNNNNSEKEKEKERAKCVSRVQTQSQDGERCKAYNSYDYHRFKQRHSTIRCENGMTKKASDTITPGQNVRRINSSVMVFFLAASISMQTP